MSQLKAYPEYKDSGIEWIGDIPKNWSVSRLKNYIKHIRNGLWGKEQNNDENDVYCVRVADFDRNKARVVDKELTIRNIPLKDQATYILEKGDLLIEKSGGGEKQPVGYTVLYNLNKRAVYTNFIAKLEMDQNKVNSNFMSFLFETMYTHRINLKSIKQTTGIQNLDTENYMNENVAYPSINEQIKIVDFLNVRTTEIDNLISDKERLIELLEEKRQAVITETVTKGLDSNVKMKDSGIEWIGNIPEHWDLIKLKYLTVMKSGDFINTSDITLKGKYRVYGGGGFRGYTSNYTHESKHILIGRQGALCGNITFASGKFWATEHAITVKSKTSNIEWLGYLMESMNLNQYSISAAQPGLSVNKISNLYIPVPTDKEQVEIANLVKYQDKEIEDVNNLIEKQISKLKEYRESLIYEAVTGKVDVREI